MSDTTKIKLLAWIHILLGGAGLGFGLLLLGLLAASTDKGSTAAAFIVPMVLMFGAMFFLPGFVGGIGLLRGRPWARLLLIVLSAVELLAIPIGTIIGAIGLWILFSPGVAAQFRAPPPLAGGATGAAAAGPWAGAADVASVGSGILSPERRGVLVAMAGVAAGFVVAISTGFMISGQPLPPELAPLYAPALVVLAATLVLGVRAVVTGRIKLRPSPAREDVSAGFFRGARAARSAAAAQTERLARLAADPRRSRYVALIGKGETWTDAQIDYDLDPSATVTCAHLKPIERAIRAAGIRVKRWAGADVGADCTIDQAALKRRFAPPVCVRYEEPPPYDRATEDSPVALLRCASCRSSIIAWHPSTAEPGSKPFPSP